MDPDWVECGSLIGELDGRLVAHAAFMRLRETGAAEVAFTVADEHQGRGIGPRLLERLAERAAEAGIERFVAEVLADNRPMLKVFEEAGFEVSRTLEGSEVEVSFPIAPTARYLDRIDRRDHLAAAASLRPFFAPSSVAVLGASRRRDSIGGRLFRNIVEAEFTGVVYPVNRAGEAVAGVRGYSSVSELPETPDLVVVCLPEQYVLSAVEEALDRGTKAICVISAGFAEVGEEGRKRQDHLLELVRSHGGRLVGPNCLGIAVAAPQPERDIRAARTAARPHRLLVAERCARARPAREGRGARAGLLCLRLRREQGRRLVERPARVLGGRPGHDR